MQLAGAPEQPILIPETCSTRFHSGEFPPHVITRNPACGRAGVIAAATNNRTQPIVNAFLFIVVKMILKRPWERVPERAQTWEPPHSAKLPRVAVDPANLAPGSTIRTSRARTPNLANPFAARPPDFHTSPESPQQTVLDRLVAQPRRPATTKRFLRFRLHPQ